MITSNNHTQAHTMFQVKKISPLYKNNDDHVTVLATRQTKSEAIEALRAHFLNSNVGLIKLSHTIKVPACIVELAQNSIDRNADLDIVVRDDGVVFVDGNGPEMDYYTITS